MLECLSFRSLTSSVPNLPPPPSPSQGNSTDEDTPATSTRSSPGPIVSREYDLAVQANSYNEIRSVIQAPPPQDQLHYLEDVDEDSHHRQVLAQVLQPDRESVREALASAKPTSTLTRLASTYFDHSETTSDLCLLLYRGVNRARAMYAPLFDLIAVLPADSGGSFSQSHCDRAYDLFLQFDCQDNPFIFPHSHNNFSVVRSSFSDLKLQIKRRSQKCHSRIRLLRHATSGCAVCFIVTAVGVVVSAVIVTTHAVVGFAAVAATPFCNANIPYPKKTERKERARLKQLDAAEKSNYVMDDVDTIDSLVDRLQTAVEGHKALVRFALERGRDRYPIQEVLKQLRKNQPSFEHLLRDLEIHICLCLNTVNKARKSLLEEICLHQTL